MKITIFPNDKGLPSGKLADAEVHFTDGPLAGLRLIGFGIWERRTGGGQNVTFPARTYSVNGERRSFALLRPSTDGIEGQERLRALILQAYAEYEEQTAAPAPSMPAFDPTAAFTAPTSAPTMAAICADVAAGKPVALTDIIDAQRAERQAAPTTTHPRTIDLF